jgi:hypothetical protein
VHRRRPPDAGREDAALGRRDGVVAEQASGAPDEREGEGGAEGDHAQEEEQAVPAQRAPHAGTQRRESPAVAAGGEREADLVQRDGRGQREREHQELRTGEEGHADRGEGERVPPRAGPDQRAMDGQDRPHEGGIRGHLGHDHRGHRHPRDGDGERGAQEARPAGPRDLSSEEEGGHGRAGHDEGVEDVHGAKRRRRGQEPVHRRGQEGVEMAERAEGLAV